MPPAHCFQTCTRNGDRETPSPPFSSHEREISHHVYKKVTDPFTESVRAKIIGCQCHSPNYGTHPHPSSFTFPQEEEEEDLRICACGRPRCKCAINCTNKEEEEEEEEEDDDDDEDGGGKASSTHAWNLLETTRSVGALCIPDDLTLVRHVSMALEGAPCQKVGDGTFSLLGHIVKHLRAQGYNAGLCKSQWAHNSSTSLVAGSYEYIDVVMAAGKKERLIVDVNFRSEFQIARAEEQYGVLLEALPLVFVGRLQSLKQVVKLMCQVAEQSLRRQGLEVPPWRKCQYMQHKWLSSYRRTIRETTEKKKKNDVSSCITLNSTHLTSHLAFHVEQVFSFCHTNTNTNRMPACRKERPNIGGLSRALLLQQNAC